MRGSLRPVSAGWESVLGKRSAADREVVAEEAARQAEAGAQLEGEMTEMLEIWIARDGSTESDARALVDLAISVGGGLALLAMLRPAQLKQLATACRTDPERLTIALDWRRAGGQYVGRGGGAGSVRLRTGGVRVSVAVVDSADAKAVIANRVAGSWSVVDERLNGLRKTLRRDFYLTDEEQMENWPSIIGREGAPDLTRHHVYQGDFRREFERRAQAKQFSGAFHWRHGGVGVGGMIQLSVGGAVSPGTTLVTTNGSGFMVAHTYYLFGAEQLDALLAMQQLSAALRATIGLTVGYQNKADLIDAFAEGVVGVWRDWDLRRHSLTRGVALRAGDLWTFAQPCRPMGVRLQKDRASGQYGFQIVHGDRHELTQEGMRDATAQMLRLHQQAWDADGSAREKR